MKKKKNVFGAWAFLIGVVLALAIGIFSDLTANTWLLGALVVIGLIVGLLNISSKEVTPFLLSGVILIIASTFSAGVLSVIPRAISILSGILALIVPATIVVAIKNVFIMAKN